jgi:hypothetical protein
MNQGLKILLALATCSLVFASDQAVKTVETTVMEAPVIGKISTLKTSYFTECRMLEVREMKFHNVFAALFSEDRKTTDGTLTDYCRELVWELDYDDEEYRQKTFEQVRAELQEEDNEIVIESDDDPPIITRTVEQTREDVNGFKARKVVTLIRAEEMDRPLILEEWYTRKLPGADMRDDVRTSIDRALDREDDVYHGVPDFIQKFFDAMDESGQGLEEVPGYLIKAEIRLEDDDGDAIFYLRYNLEKIAKLSANEKTLSIPADFRRVD